MTGKLTGQRWLGVATVVIVVGAVLCLLPVLARTGSGLSNGCPSVPNTPYFTIACGIVVRE